MLNALSNVRFWGQSGRDSNGPLCRLMTQSGRCLSLPIVEISSSRPGCRRLCGYVTFASRRKCSSVGGHHETHARIRCLTAAFLILGSGAAKAGQTINDVGAMACVNDKWDVKEPEKGHKLVDYAGRCVNI